MQAKPAKSPRQSLSAKTPSSAPAAAARTASKPPAGKTPATANKAAPPTYAARSTPANGQLTQKLEKSSSTPLVEVVAGDMGTLAVCRHD